MSPSKPRGPAPPTPNPSPGPGTAAGNPVVGDAASAGAATGTDTTPSSDWLAERERSPADLPPEQRPRGVEVSTRSSDGLRKGRTTESKRGQR